MILSRLSKAVREQNWFAVAIEFVIVLAGVMLAFQATLWNEQRQDRETQALFMDRLASDFAQLETDAAFAEDVYDDVTLATSRAIEFILSDQDYTADYPESAFRDDLDRMMQGTAPVGSSPTFREMQSGGLLRYVEDDDLRDALIRFELEVQQTQDVWEIFVGMQMDYAAPVMSAMRFDDTVSDTATDDGLNVGWVDLDRIRSDPEILGALTMIRRAHVYNRGWQGGIADAAADISRSLGNPVPDNVSGQSLRAPQGEGD